MTDIKTARRNLSIAEANKPHLHDWVGAENYEAAKAANQKMADEARKTLTEESGGSIWYYSELPTMGNKFRSGNVCGLTGMPWAEARELSIAERRKIASKR